MTKAALKTVVTTGRFQMHPTLQRADIATHVKIVLVSLVAATVVVFVGINARSFDATTATGPTIVKAKQTPTYAGKDAMTIR